MVKGCNLNRSLILGIKNTCLANFTLLVQISWHHMISTLSFGLMDQSTGNFLVRKYNKPFSN